MNRYKTDNQIIDKLFSTQSEIVIGAIDELKEEGSAAYLPFLFQLLRSGCIEEVEKSLLHLLGTVKQADCVPVFMDAIQSEENKAIQKKLIAVCWQNGLAFENYLPVFVDFMITGDWETAFESFTLVENLINLPSPEIIEVSIHKIKQSLKTVSETNRYFLFETLKILE